MAKKFPPELAPLSEEVRALMAAGMSARSIAVGATGDADDRGEWARRMAEETQVPRPDRIAAMKAYLRQHNAAVIQRTAILEATSQHAKAARRGVPAHRLPRDQALEGHYATDHLDFGHAALELRAHGDGVIEAFGRTTYDGIAVTSHGSDALPPEGLLVLRMRDERGHNFVFVQLDEDSGIWDGTPVQQLVLLRFGFPAQIDQSEADAEQQRNDYLRRVRFTFRRVEGKELSWRH